MDEIMKKKLSVPEGIVDVILDTDAYNEIDDQFAISYLVRSKDAANVIGFYAAPFFNENSTGPADGMERSYFEIKKVLKLAGEEALSEKVWRGSTEYLPDENTPVESEAAKDLAERAMSYTPEHPLYVVAIGAITNVASALLMNPAIKDNIVVVWLGGHAHQWPNTREFNMFQDVAAARVVMGSGCAFVQLPCMGVVSEFRVSQPELQYWLIDKNPLADYLARNTMKAANKYAEGKPWTRVVWDVTAVAWITNRGGKFLNFDIRDVRLSDYQNIYEEPLKDHPFAYVWAVNRDALMEDLINKLTK